MCKVNAARHGLKVGDMVGILGPTATVFFASGEGNHSFIGRIGRIKAIGNFPWEGKYAVFVNGRHEWFAPESLVKISRRGCFSRPKTRRKTAPESGRKEYRAGKLTSSVPELPWQLKIYDASIIGPDGQEWKLNMDTDSAPISAPHSGEYEATVGAGAGSEPQPEAPKAEPKFKVGDRVEIYRRASLWDSLWDMVGAVGTIVRTDVDVSDKISVVDFFGDGRQLFVPERILRHAAAEPSPATESAPEPEKQQFKPFDRVLVRDADNLAWMPALFSVYMGGFAHPYHMVGGKMYAQCIPYEGNEALVGTTNDPEKG